MAIKSDPGKWTDPRHRRGLAGERIAMRFLRLRGWRILHHRLRMGRIEVDLVAQCGPLVAFIEVKTRGGRSFGSPLEAVTWSKQRDVARAARAWADRYGMPGTQYRFDVIGVTMTSSGPLVQHVQDAYRAGWR
jgi:putative endonuclease